MYETGSQIRRSSKSICANIVEGYGRRRYKQDYIRFLIYAQASADETIDHLDTLFETGSLKDDQIYESLTRELSILGKKIYRYTKTVERIHKT
ncbi:MAG: four helix bundle protein [Balneolaceae bacterium]|nr:four helix bundle protein [Balneolaceae bacterium]